MLFRSSCDWKGVGESTYDLARLFLVDPSVSLSAGNSYSMSGSANTAPAGFIPIDGGKMNLQSNWVNKTLIFTVTEERIYNLVLFWKNDGGGGSNPPFAIDNLVVEELTCAPVSDFSISATAYSIYLSWVNLLGPAVWDVKGCPSPLDIQIMVSQIGDRDTDT